MDSIPYEYGVITIIYSITFYDSVEHLNFFYNNNIIEIYYIFGNAEVLCYVIIYLDYIRYSDTIVHILNAI